MQGLPRSGLYLVLSLLTLFSFGRGSEEEFLLAFEIQRPWYGAVSQAQLFRQGRTYFMKYKLYRDDVSVQLSRDIALWLLAEDEPILVIHDGQYEVPNHSVPTPISVFRSCRVLMN